MIVSTQQVRDIALENPASVRVFEAYSIDYCCGGHKPLAEACKDKNVAVEKVLQALKQAGAGTASSPEKWTAKPLVELISHILEKHHAYIRKELPRLEELAVKVIDRHGSMRSELYAIQSGLKDLGAELLPHLDKEEMILFPYITQLEQSHQTGNAKPQAIFASVSMPVTMMMHQHEVAGKLAERIRQLSSDYTLPEDACPTYYAYYTGLREFTEDLHRHIHLENNILFPRAIEVEQSMA